jgi:hypothetical protein
MGPFGWQFEGEDGGFGPIAVTAFFDDPGVGQFDDGAGDVPFAFERGVPREPERDGGDDFICGKLLFVEVFEEEIKNPKGERLEGNFQEANFADETDENGVAIFKFDSSGTIGANDCRVL